MAVLEKRLGLYSSRRELIWNLSGKHLREFTLMRASAMRIGFFLHAVTFLASATGASELTAADADPAEARTSIVNIPAKQGETRATVALANPTCSDDLFRVADTVQGILARELFRQAFLIAARDELGLSTRDEVLGDAAPLAAGQAAQIELATVFHRTKGKPNQVVVRRLKQGDDETLLNLDLGANQTGFGDLVKLCEVAERLSREQFPKVLRQLGLEGKPNVLRPGGEQTKGTEERLSHLGFLEPFTAVRDGHQAIRADGESVERLGALVRGYSLLGVLTEHHWHPAHKVFKARGLLYAQRLVAREEKGAFGLWHRAYAGALIGVHTNALADIAAARSQQDPKGEPGQPPWADLVEAYAKQDLPRMNKEKNNLAALLRMLAVEYPTMTDLTLLAAKEVIAADPECYRAVETMCGVGGVTNLHEATTIGPQTLAQTLPQKIQAIESIPKVVRDQFDDAKAGEPALFAALAQAGAPDADRGEPSWAVLGRLIQETRFMQVWRRIAFLRGPLATSTAEFWKEAAPAVAGHRYEVYLEALVSRGQVMTRTLDQLTDHLDIANAQMSERFMLATIYRTQNARAQIPWKMAYNHIDNNAHDLAEFVRAADGLDQATAALSLMAISPGSHYAKAVTIEKNWERAKEHLTEWEKDADSSPAILAALAKRYRELGKTEEAQHALVRYIRFSPDYWAYEQIAKNFKAAGDLTRWESTLEDYLKKAEEHGLTHAQVRVELARHYMEKKQWDKAWPYAKAAAEESGAQWALMCASECAVSRNDWEAAEHYAQGLSQRYPPSGWGYWFLFCVKTGHGDAAAARAFALDYLKPIREQPERAQPGPIGYFNWLAGDSKNAMLWFRHAYASSPSVHTCFNLITLADESGDTVTREEVIRLLLGKHRKQGPVAARIYEELRKGLNQGAGGSLDLKAIDAILENVPPASWGLNSYLVGLFLKNHGKADDCRRYLESALELPGNHEWSQAKAIKILRELDGHEKAPASEKEKKK